MAIIPKDQLKALNKKYNLKDAKDIQGMLKTLFGDTLKEMLEAVSQTPKLPYNIDYK